MPQRLKQRQEKIQDKRKQTPWREFVKEVCSWFSLNLYRNKEYISRYPISDRNPIIISNIGYENPNTSESNIQKENIFSSIFQLFKNTELPNLMAYGNNVDATFADAVYGVNKAYLSFSTGISSSNVLYSNFVWNNTHNVLNSVYVEDSSENIYSSLSVQKGYNVFYSRYITNSSNIWFSSNLIGCKDCIFCDNLQNVQYCINNKQTTKGEYLKYKEKLLLKKILFEKYYDNVNMLGNNYGSNNSEGGGLIKCENVKQSYMCRDIKDGRNLYFSSGGNNGSKSFFDGIDIGVDCDNFYGVCGAGTNSSHLYFCQNINISTHMYYCIFCDNCSYCLGCIGLKNKSYCILNKQYTKEERYDKVDEIFTQMEKDGTLGEFFPGTMNPFYFNDTAAYLIDDTFTKEEVEAEGYLRRDEKIKVDIPEGAEIVHTYSTSSQNKPPLNTDPSVPQSGTAPLQGEPSKSLSLEERCPKGGEVLHKGGSKQRRDSLNDYQGRKVGNKFYPISEIGNKVPKVDSGAERWINPEILNKVIQDKEGNYYKIVKMEYDFLMKHGLPLPKLHWLDRIKLGFRFK
ncbi:MAG: hypothetical protein CR971_00995 [candidate division SR1 bacterium]|nr:MAG: hypothetical protein CR971_00995 [candidate division SR1 bacterium]